MRYVRLVGEAILAGARDPAAFGPYVAERRERLRRLRITASLSATRRAARLGITLTLDLRWVFRGVR